MNPSTPISFCFLFLPPTVASNCKCQLNSVADNHNLKSVAPFTQYSDNIYRFCVHTSQVILIFLFKLNNEFCECSICMAKNIIEF